MTSLPVLGGIVVALIGLRLVPPGYRLYFALILLPLWITLNRLETLGTLSAIAKATSVFAYGLVGIAAWFHPGPRRRLPPVLWWYVAGAVIWMLCIAMSPSFLRNMLIQVQWLVLVASALAVARVIADKTMLQYVFRAIGFGCLLSVFLLFYGSISSQHTIMRQDSRLWVFGANPNQYGTMLALGGVFALFFVFRDPRPALRWVWLGGLVMAGLTGLMTGSRSVVVLLAVPAVALLLLGRGAVWIKVLATLAIVCVVAYSVGNAPAVSRITNFSTDRTVIAQQYVGVILNRPLTGILGQTGFNVAHAPGLTHPHNAYLRLLYLGGLLLFIPHFILMVATAVGWLRLWRARRQMHFDQDFLVFFGSLMLVIYAHGFVNVAIYYPTYAWSFVHILLSSVIIVSAHAMQPRSSYELPESAMRMGSYSLSRP
ncbi:MAG: hypothetical protein AAGH92_13545 [Planctomycetota bacterium]